MNPSSHPGDRRCCKCGARLDNRRAGDVCLSCALENAVAPQSTADATSTEVGGGTDRPEPSPASRLGSFGDYELLEEIARGGMGVVFKARQASLDRLVAVKMLLFGPLASPEVVQRFRAEAAAAASLQHPNIVVVHEVGFRDGQHFIAMDYVAGRSLADIVRDGPLTARRAAGYVQTIAEAIQYAHERGILHRDLKPSNVLLDEHDQPKVTDFGLAKRLDKDTELTLSGQVLGSPNYMPPEQAAAHRGLVGKRSDVYSLGAILSHLLTGRAPFVAPTVPETLQQVQNAEPVSPTILNPVVPRDLKTICLKCLEKEPARRYETAQELADELGRFLADKPILARPVSRPEKVWRWCRRKPLVASLIAATVVAILLGFAGVLWQWRRANFNARAEASQRQRAEANFQSAREVIDRMVIRVAEELAEPPRMEQLRRRLLEEALQFYERFLSQKGEDPTVRHGTALAYLRVGGIYDTLGEYNQCLAPLGKGIAMLEDLAQRRPVEARDREEMARAHHTMGVVNHRLLLDTGPAITHWRKALALYEGLQREFPSEPKYWRATANSHVGLGIGLKAANRPDEAIDQFQQALKLCENHRTLAPDAPEDRVVRAHIHHWLGVSLEYTGRREEAERAYRAAHDLRQQLVAEQPNNAWLKHLLAHIKTYLAELLMKSGRLDEAVELLQHAVALDEKLLEDFPDVSDYRTVGGSGFESLGKVLAALGRPREAEAAFRRSVAIREKLVADIPSVSMHSDNLAASCYYLGVVLETTGRSGEAAEVFRQALAIWEQLVAPATPSLKTRSCERRLAWMLATCPAVAFRDPQRAVTLAKQSFQSEGDTARHWSLLGIAQYRTGDYPAVIESLRKSMELANGGDAQQWLFLAMSHWQRQDRQQARQWYDKAAAWIEKTHPADEVYVRFRAEAASLLGVNTTGEVRSDDAKRQQTPP
ncbi:MAG: serine/threonine-protein kinase [Verrucomicrobiota bacterium]